MTVFANGLEISSKAQGCKVIAAFPDTCMTPPQAPPTPPGVPIPYPDFGFDSDTTKGTGTVKIGGKEVSQENASKYSKCSGDEAGAAPKKGLVTSTNTGAIYAQKWSMNVKFEGKGVVRFTDMATGNHSSNPGDSPPMVIVGKPAAPAVDAPESDDDEDICPCCKGPMHPNQRKKSDPTKRRDTVKEKDFYKNQVETAKANKRKIESTSAADFAATPISKGISQADFLTKWEKKIAEAEAAYKEYESKRDPKCLNVHDPEDEDCGVHFSVDDRDDQAPDGWTTNKADEIRTSWVMKKEYPDFDKDAAALKAMPGSPAKGAEIKRIKAKVSDANKSDYAKKCQGQVNHMTPRVAGGCNSAGNTVPDGLLEGDCADVEAAQTILQNIGPVAL